ncbi:hypothetical protein ATN84_16260 [Paramesorhizobium deserti]|uniref:Uncharacterized protein n=1 Tax=Paramesorhizobium deserti TaxID=1494590 RepID=A0A135HTB5_9HYPH|nr:hypothetical protein ATN84_16260 [Paramesorhizobium deserti]
MVRFWAARIQRLILAEGLLDRIEVGRVWGQIPEPCAGGFDHLPDGGRLVRAEIVHDDDVARFKHQHELLLDIGAEALAVDRSVEDARRRQPVVAQSAQEGQRTPVAVRGKAAQALAAWSPAPQRRHVGLDPGLVDEHQPCRIETGLPRTPALPPAGNIGTGLLKGEQRFF